MIKVFIGTLLILLLALNSSSYFIAFKILEFNIKKEIKTKIKKGVPESELILLKIPALLEEKSSKEFQMIHEKEFRYKGEMYDIVKKEKKNDTTYYYCIHDKEETRLFANLEALIINELNNPDKKKELNSILKIFNSFYLISDKNKLLQPSRSDRIFYYYSDILISIVKNPLTPPPEFIV
jgi:hypothetical protein